MPTEYSTSSKSQTPETNLSKRVAALVACASVALTIGVMACDDLVTEQVTVVVAGHPTAEFTADVDSGCAPLTVVFSDKSSGPHDQWLWDFGDGDTANDTSPTHTYTSPGTYDVSLKIIDNDSVPAANDVEVKKRFIIVGSSSAGFTMDTASGCVGLTVNFTPTFQGTGSFGVSSISWDFGDGTSSTDTMPTHTFNTIGVFPVTLSLVSPCGADTAVDTVRIVECPTFGIIADQRTGCLGMTVQFTDSTADSIPHVNRTWDFGDGMVASDTLSIITHTYNDTGLFTVALTVDNTNSVSFTDSSVGFIQVFDSLAADFAAISPTFDCKTATSQFVVGFSDNSRGNITNRVWNFGDGTFDSTNNPNPFHAYTTTGKYTVQLIATGMCGVNASDTATKKDFVTLAGPLTPGISRSLVSSDTANVTYRFKDISLGVPSTSTWDFGDSTTAVSTDTTHTYPNTTATYIITLTVKNVCSQDSAVAIDSVVIP